MIEVASAVGVACTVSRATAESINRYLMMIAWEELSDPLIRLEKDGRHWRISVVEFDPPRDMSHARAAALHRLRDEKFVPGELIDLVEGYKDEAKVQLVGKKEGQGLRLSVKKIGNLKSGEGMPASEALALFLRILLRELRLSERRRRAAVRAHGLFPRSLIGVIALDLLIGCQVAECAPGPMLGALFQELLELDTAPAASTKSNLHEELAFIVAQDPSISTRELARGLDVNPGTVSRCRRSPAFKKALKTWTTVISRKKEDGEWPPLARRKSVPL